MRTDFGVIIISHGRPECSTFHELRGRKYTGKLFVLIDDEDSEKDAYLERYGASVRVFHKQVNFDIMDNFDGPNGVATFARNECWNVAEREGLKYFLMMDDDLKQISFRWIDGKVLRNSKCKNFEAVICAYLDFMDETGIDCTGFGAPGEYIGGAEGFAARRFMRWTTGSFFLRTKSRFDFIGRYSEDGIASILESQRGKVFSRPTDVCVNYAAWFPGERKEAKLRAGGCADAYRQQDGFAIRFYTVIALPSCIVMSLDKYGGWGNTIHNSACWPRILPSKYRKGSE